MATSHDSLTAVAGYVACFCPFAASSSAENGAADNAARGYRSLSFFRSMMMIITSEMTSAAG